MQQRETCDTEKKLHHVCLDEADSPVVSELSLQTN